MPFSAAVIFEPAGLPAMRVPSLTWEKRPASFFSIAARCLLLSGLCDLESFLAKISEVVGKTSVAILLCCHCGSIKFLLLARRLHETPHTGPCILKNNCLNQKHAVTVCACTYART